MPLPAETPAIASDAESGKVVYTRCTGCHSPDRNRAGPLHCGVVGRVSGTVDGFRYSPAMRRAAIVWSAETLDRFLEAPLATLPGTSMGFAGIRDDAERRQLIAWLATLTESSRYCNGVPAQ